MDIRKEAVREYLEDGILYRTFPKKRKPAFAGFFHKFDSTKSCFQC